MGHSTSGIGDGLKAECEYDHVGGDKSDKDEGDGNLLQGQQMLAVVVGNKGMRCDDGSPRNGVEIHRSHPSPDFSGVLQLKSRGLQTCKVNGSPVLCQLLSVRKI